jgi:DNA-binding MarR family transcriptional regulator
MDKEIANFHLNSIKNGFMGGTMINFFNGQPSEEEQAIIERKLYDKFSGSDNANKLVLNFNDSKEQGAEIIALNGNDFDKRFDTLNKTVQTEIFAGHRIVDPQLFGIKESGIFASRNQIRDSYELFQNTYVNGRQRFLEEVFNGLLAVQGFDGRLLIKDTEPIGREYSEATRASVMTTDEIREDMGLAPLASEQMSKELQLAKEDHEIEMRICDHFSKDGYSLDEYEIVGSGRQVRFTSDTQLAASESIIKRFGFTSEAFDFAVLEILKKTPTATWESIAAQLESTIDEVTTAIQKLTSANYMTIGSDIVADSSQRTVEVTPQGNAALETAEPLEVTFKVAYRYVKSGEASGADVIPTTREFCKRMVAASKSRVWDSAQIQEIGMTEDRNVWLRRGGFWTRKGTNITTPYCRHVWEQVVIKEKG